MLANNNNNNNNNVHYTTNNNKNKNVKGSWSLFSNYSIR